MNDALGTEEDNQQTQENTPPQTNPKQQDQQRQQEQAELHTQTPQEQKNIARKKQALKKLKEYEGELDPKRAKMIKLKSAKYMLGLLMIVLTMIYFAICLLTIGIAFLYFHDYGMLMRSLYKRYKKLEEKEEKIQQEIDPLEQQEEEKTKEIKAIDNNQAQIQQQRRKSQQKRAQNQQNKAPNNVRQLRPRQNPQLPQQDTKKAA